MLNGFEELKRITAKEISIFTILETLKSKKINLDYKTLVSFELLDREHDYFNLGEIDNICNSWYLELLDMLKEFNSMPFNAFLLKHASQKHETHLIDFEKSNFKFFKEHDINQYKEISFQIRINKGKGRVHGILIENVFYIVWLDPHHNMSDSKNRYGGKKKLTPSKHCSEKIREAEIEIKAIEEAFFEELKELEIIKNIMKEKGIINLEDLAKRL